MRGRRQPTVQSGGQGPPLDARACHRQVQLGQAHRDPPFVAYQVTCGITLTYGGLAIDGEARVENEEGVAIDGLYACGELVGGLYYDRYPGGAGLTSGAVFGRIAGRLASRKPALVGPIAGDVDDRAAQPCKRRVGRLRRLPQRVKFEGRQLAAAERST